MIHFQFILFVYLMGNDFLSDFYQIFFKVMKSEKCHRNLSRLILMNNFKNI